MVYFILKIVVLFMFLFFILLFILIKKVLWLIFIKFYFLLIVIREKRLGDKNIFLIDVNNNIEGGNMDEIIIFKIK